VTETSAWLTAGVALITAVAGLTGSFIGSFMQARSAMVAAQRQAAAAAAVARSDRFATWQMHKREVYANLLQVIQASARSSDQAIGSELADALARALVVAHSDLRDHLMRLEANVLLIREPDYRRDLVERLMADVRQTGADT